MDIPEKNRLKIIGQGKEFLMNAYNVVPLKTMNPHTTTPYVSRVGARVSTIVEEKLYVGTVIEEVEYSDAFPATLKIRWDVDDKNGISWPDEFVNPDEITLVSSTGED